jgi:hypothetical protein
MRKSINENRTMQLVLLAVLALAGGFLLLKTTHGSGSGSGSASTPAASTGSSDSSGVAATAAVPVDTSAPSASGGATQSAPVVPTDQLPGSGVPKSLLASYRRGDAVALLVVRAGGTDDALVRGSLGRLQGVPRLSVYVTKAKGIARYAWLTEGVDVTELPALVVLRPRGLTNGVPTASVSYGFRDAASVLQAAKDALYKGPADLPYHP